MGCASWAADPEQSPLRIPYQNSCQDRLNRYLTDVYKFFFEISRHRRCV